MVVYHIKNEAGDLTISLLSEGVEGKDYKEMPKRRRAPQPTAPQPTALLLPF